VASIPNIMHISILAELLQGRWTYQDAGILDKTHLRFFTRYEIEKMFLTTGLDIIQMAYNAVPVTPEQNKLKENLLHLPETLKDHKQFDAYQWIVIAQNREDEEARTSFICGVEDLLNNRTSHLMKLLELVQEERVSAEQMYDWIEEKFAEKKVKAIVDLTVMLYKNNLQETALNLIEKAYKKNPSDADLTYANAFLLFTYGDVKGAKLVINNALDKSEELNGLLAEIENIVQ
jgi:tetratricopeptide (TPR) repeat protein